MTGLAWFRFSRCLHRPRTTGLLQYSRRNLSEGPSIPSYVSEASEEEEMRLRTRGLFDVIRLGTVENLNYWFKQINSVDVNCTNEIDQSLLHVAAELGRTDMMKILLDMGATINRQDKFGDTPLIAAARENHVGAVRLLLNKGAQSDIVSLDNMTAADHTSDLCADALIRSPTDSHCDVCVDFPSQM